MKLPSSYVFIVGVPRSGTTWLQIMLASHPSIATSRETHLFDIYLNSVFSRWETEVNLPDHDGLRVLFEAKEFLELCKNFSDSVFDRIMSSKPDSKVLLEKTPGHIFHYKAIRSLYPSAKFINIIRDPRSVVASLLAASRESWGKWAPNNVTSASKQWIDTVNFAKYGLKQDLGADYQELRYEDLLNDPNKSVSGILTWLELAPMDINVSDFSIDYIKSKNEQGPLYKPERENRTNFFRNGTADSWRQELTTEQVSEIEGVCGDIMKEYMYL